MIIELKGIQFANLGAQLMLHAVLDRLHVMYPSALLAVRESPRLTTRQRQSIGALRLLPMRKGQLDLNRLSYLWPKTIHVLLRQWDYVAEGNLSMTIDVSGYAYGDRWGNGPLCSTAHQIERFSASGKPYIFAPQSFGPFAETRDAANNFVASLKKASLVVSRDKQSTAWLSQLNDDLAETHLDVLQIPDLTFGLVGYHELSGHLGIDRQTALIVPNVRMVDGSSSAAPAGQYLALLHRLSCELEALGFSIKILNHSGTEDRELCLQLLALLKKDLDHFIDCDNAREIKGVIGSSGLVIASRFHACVSALDQGVPCIATSWSHKYRQLFTDFGLAELVLQNLDPAASVRVLRQAIAEQDKIRQHCASVQSHMKTGVELFWQKVSAMTPTHSF